MKRRKERLHSEIAKGSSNTNQQCWEGMFWSGFKQWQIKENRAQSILNDVVCLNILGETLGEDTDIL